MTDIDWAGLVSAISGLVMAVAAAVRLRNRWRAIQIAKLEQETNEESES